MREHLLSICDIAIYLEEPHKICRSSPTIGMNVRGLLLFALAVSLHYLPRRVRSAFT